MQCSLLPNSHFLTLVRNETEEPTHSNSLERKKNKNKSGIKEPPVLVLPKSLQEITVFHEKAVRASARSLTVSCF
jgi:hypothetical protein